MGDLVRAGFERKYLVPEGGVADALLATLQERLAPDPWAGPDGQYAVLSLYLDTPDLAAYRRDSGGKWRLRRYGDSDRVFVEHKEKPEPGRVHKRRTALDDADVAGLADHEGEARWFAQLMRQHALAPTRLVGYRRHAFVGDLDGRSVRVTLDRDVRGMRADRLHLPRALDGGAALVPGRLLEIKFDHALPTALEAALASLGLEAQPLSKYRLAVERA